MYSAQDKEGIDILRVSGHENRTVDEPLDNMIDLTTILFHSFCGVSIGFSSYQNSSNFISLNEQTASRAN